MSPKEDWVSWHYERYLLGVGEGKPCEHNAKKEGNGKSFKQK